MGKENNVRVKQGQDFSKDFGASEEITLKMKKWELDEANKEMNKMKEMIETLQNKINSWIVVGEGK